MTGPKIHLDRIDVPCSACGAQPGQRCVALSAQAKGHRVPPHPGRIWFADGANWVLDNLANVVAEVIEEGGADDVAEVRDR